MQKHKEAKLAFLEFKKYLEEIRDATVLRLEQSPNKDEGSLVENFVKAGTPDLQEDVNLSISPSAVLGNFFIFILAGYETGANLMANAITILACRPDVQTALQTEIDALVGDQSPTEQSYTILFRKLMDGYVGALMKETMRLYTVLPFIPKSIFDSQTIVVDGEQHVLPKGTLIMINTSALHTSPKHWPQPREDPFPGEGPPYPLSSFFPERWIRPKDGHPNPGDYFNPPPGAYMPFGEGFRQCMGSRFAKVEFCAAIANIFRHYRVELANGNTQEAMRDAAEKLSIGVGFGMGLKMGEPVELKFLKRDLEAK